MASIPWKSDKFRQRQFPTSRSPTKDSSSEVKYAIVLFDIVMAVFSLILNEMLEGEQVGFNSRRLHHFNFFVFNHLRGCKHFQPGFSDNFQTIFRQFSGRPTDSLVGLPTFSAKTDSLPLMMSKQVLLPQSSSKRSAHNAATIEYFDREKTFRGFDPCLLKACSVDGLSFKNNRNETSAEYTAQHQDAKPFNVELNDQMTFEAPSPVKRQGGFGRQPACHFLLTPHGLTLNFALWCGARKTICLAVL